jgi:mannose-1-phosphate guanylyltransferase
MKRYAVLMAGGKGERFWPWSRSSLPKQFLNLIGEYSLVQQTCQRIQDLFEPVNILAVTGSEYETVIRQQLPQLPDNNFIIEPQGRNTAPCIGLAAMHIRQRDPGAVMLVFPADHMIKGQDDFLKCLEKAMDLAASSENLVTIGVIPNRPETGYGYIEREEEALPGKPPAFRVRRFVEKPDVCHAVKYLQSGRYFWNSGIFAWKADVILKKIAKYTPELYKGLAEIEAHVGTRGEEKATKKIFPLLPSISIDYGVMEKEEDILVVQGDFGWDDLGSWGALAECAKDQEQTLGGEHVGVDTVDCFVYGQDALIATLGVQGLVIVQSGNVVMVCSKERTQEVKILVQSIKKRGLEKYL